MSLRMAQVHKDNKVVQELPITALKKIAIGRREDADWVAMYICMYLVVCSTRQKWIHTYTQPHADHRASIGLETTRDDRIKYNRIIRHRPWLSTRNLQKWRKNSWYPPPPTNIKANVRYKNLETVHVFCVRECIPHSKVEAN